LKGVEKSMEETMKKKLAERILEVAPEKRLSCKKAFALAAEFDCLPIEVGKLCDELEVKIYGCQLGCF
jgi:hypothetical protein